MDYPEPGMCTIFVKSLSNPEEMPEQPKRVRANLIIIGFVFKKAFDELTGKEITEVFFVNSVDIMGNVPKWMINMAGKSIPKGWFATYEKES